MNDSRQMQHISLSRVPLPLGAASPPERSLVLVEEVHVEEVHVGVVHVLHPAAWCASARGAHAASAAVVGELGALRRRDSRRSGGA